jgi:hypothetical protein
MKPIVCLLIAATLLFGYGCAKTDCIDRTLVTVDVTGTCVVEPPFARSRGVK